MGGLGHRGFGHRGLMRATTSGGLDLRHRSRLTATFPNQAAPLHMHRPGGNGQG